MRDEVEYNCANWGGEAKHDVLATATAAGIIALVLARTLIAERDLVAA